MPEYGIITGAGLLGIFTGNSMNPPGFIGISDHAMIDSLICSCPDAGETLEILISGT